jgi:hypothetical protein
VPAHLLQNEYTGDAQLVNSVCLDNESLEIYHARLDQRPNSVAVRVSWYGPEEPHRVHFERKTYKDIVSGAADVSDSFFLAEHDVVDFLEGTFSADQAVQYWQSEVCVCRSPRRGFLAEPPFNCPRICHAAQGMGEAEVAKALQLFSEVQKVVDAKQLKPMVRTQYMRTLFQVSLSASHAILFLLAGEWVGSSVVLCSRCADPFRSHCAHQVGHQHMYDQGEPRGGSLVHHCGPLVPGPLVAGAQD